MTNLEKYLYQLRRIEEHREKAAEKEIRKIYKEVLREVNGYIGNIYATYSEGDMLDYSMLAKAGMDARFLEEVEGRINGISPRVSSLINDTVEQTYGACYDGMRNAVVKAAGNRELLQQAFSTVTAVTPDVIRQAVQNPVAGLTLKDTLEKHRKDIIYDIKKNIGVGLSNGDRFSTMARRISESIDGDYNKAVRIVRTEAHRVRESGYNDAATDINEALKNGSSGYVMAKTWRTMDDERVRPAKAKGKARQYNHVKMDGVTIPQDAMFELPSGAKCKAPSQTGVAGEDINCRCYLSYDLVLASELKKVQDGKKTMEEAVKQEQPIGFKDDAEADKLDGYISKMDGIEQEKWIGAFNNTDYEIIENDDNFTSYYDADKKKVYFNANEKAHTSFHETAHAIDEGCINVQVTVGNLTTEIDTASGYLDFAMNTTKIDLDLQNFAREIGVTVENGRFVESEDFVKQAYSKWADKMIAENGIKGFGALSDMLSAITSDYIGSSTNYGGHEKSYWKDKYKGSSIENKEIWADFAELKATKNEKMLDLMRRVIPNRYGEADYIYRKAFLE